MWGLRLGTMPHCVARYVCAFEGHRSLTSLCPQGAPGAPGLKGDKVDGTMLLALSCTPVTPSSFH